MKLREGVCLHAVDGQCVLTRQREELELTITKWNLSLDLDPLLLHGISFGGKYDGFTLVRKLFLDFRRLLTVAKHMFHLVGSFHSSIYTTPDV